MALSEEQIVRFSRQILLKDVGGVGQERLLAARVRLSGAGAALAVAADYLAAAGVGIEAPARAVRDDEVGFGRARSEVGRPWPGGDSAAGAARTSLRARAEPRDRATSQSPVAPGGDASPPSRDEPPQEGELRVRAEPSPSDAPTTRARPGDADLELGGEPARPADEAQTRVNNQVAGARGRVIQLPADVAPDGFTVVIGSREGLAAIAFAAVEDCQTCLARTIAGWSAPPDELAALLGTAAAQLGLRLILGLERGVGLRLFQPDGAAGAGEVARCDACRARGP